MIDEIRFPCQRFYFAMLVDTVRICAPTVWVVLLAKNVARNGGTVQTVQDSTV